MAPEEALRRLQAAAEGTDPRPEITFLDARYAVITDGTLAPLLRYCAAGQLPARERARLESLGEPAKEPGQQAILAASYSLLEDCLADFSDFSAAAFAGKVAGDDVQQAVMRVIEVITARPAMAGLRLAHDATASFAELDGILLLAGGRGVAGMSAREVCNTVFARRLSEQDPELRAEWVEGLYLDYDPQSQALQMVRQMQADRAAREAGDD